MPNIEFTKQEVAYLRAKLPGQWTNKLKAGKNRVKDGDLGFLCGFTAGDDSGPEAKSINQKANIKLMPKRGKYELTVKPGLEAEWQRAVEVNKDAYGAAVIEAVKFMGHRLDLGDSPKEADEKLCKEDKLGLSMFQAGCVMQMLAQFHTRGEEVRKWWNKQWGVKSETGTVNPAILTVGPKEK